MERAVRMMQTGDFNPHFFDYPTLYMYVQAVVAVVPLPRRRGARASGRRSARRRPSDFYLWGRAVTALLGTATVCSSTAPGCAGARARRCSPRCCSR